MTSVPGSQRRTTTWIVIAVVAVLAVMATLLTINLLSNLPSGASPSATESPVASATSGSSATPIASPSKSSAPSGQKGGTWAATGALLEARYGIRATLLLDGTVLVAGGALNSEPYVLASAELYDPSTGSWTTTGAMIEARSGYSATLLPDGEVLVAGGISTIVGSSPFPLATAELYDPRTGTWTAIDSMATARTGHTATLLVDGKVLVAGGLAAFGDNIPRSTLASAELYDPGTKTWTAAAGMNEARDGHTATLLLDGKVLVVGGGNSQASAELYDSRGKTWTAVANPTEARSGYTATRLPMAGCCWQAATAPAGWPQPSSTTRPRGCGPPPGTWPTPAPAIRPRCCPMARSLLRAAAGRLPLTATALPPPSYTTLAARPGPLPGA